MKDLRLSFVDTETTGLDPWKHEIFEIGVVIGRPTEAPGDLFGTQTIELVSEHEFLITPDHPETADPKALEVSKFKGRDWSKAITRREALQAFAELVNGTVFVAQNVCFDWTFLVKECREEGIDLDRILHYHKLDLASMAFGLRYHDPKFFRFSLRELSERFEVRNADAHTALSDARTTFEVARKIIAASRRT